MEPIVAVRSLSKRFATHTDIDTLFTTGAGASIAAVDGVSFEIEKGEAFGLVGESGSGKTTLGRMLVRLEEPDAGAIHVEGKPILALRGDELKHVLGPWPTAGARVHLAQLFHEFATFA